VSNAVTKPGEPARRRKPGATERRGRIAIALDLLTAAHEGFGSPTIDRPDILPCSRRRPWCVAIPLRRVPLLRGVAPGGRITGAPRLVAPSTTKADRAFQPIASSFSPPGCAGSVTVSRISICIVSASGVAFIVAETRPAGGARERRGWKSMLVTSRTKRWLLRG
jgi:hypothetical protein